MTAPAPEGVPTPCSYIDADSGVDEETRDAIDGAIEAEVEEYSDASKMIHPSLMTLESRRPGAKMNGFVVRKAKPYNKFKSHSSGLIEKAKAALSVKRTRPSNDTREMLSGDLDEDELYRYAAKDMRIFKDATENVVPDASVYLLVDCSGSMGSWEYEGPAYHSTQIAQLFVEALARHPNVKVKVLGHTGQSEDNRTGGSFYRIWEQGDPLERLTSFGNIEYSQNFDGWAIAWAGTLLMKEPTDQKVLIVLADGEPEARGYGGVAAMDHVRSVTDQLDRKGVLVVQVALSRYLNEGNQARMFKHFITTGKEHSVMPYVIRKLTTLFGRIMK